MHVFHIGGALRPAAAAWASGDPLAEGTRNHRTNLREALSQKTHDTFYTNDIHLTIPNPKAKGSKYKLVKQNPFLNLICEIHIFKMAPKHTHISFLQSFLFIPTNLRTPKFSSFFLHPDEPRLSDNDIANIPGFFCAPVKCINRI